MNVSCTQKLQGPPPCQGGPWHFPLPPPTRTHPGAPLPSGWRPPALSAPTFSLELGAIPHLGRRPVYTWKGEWAGAREMPAGPGCSPPHPSPPLLTLQRHKPCRKLHASGELGGGRRYKPWQLCVTTATWPNMEAVCHPLQSKYVCPHARSAWPLVVPAQGS